METTYFGLQLKDNDAFDAQEIGARLFLCPRISPQLASRMVDMLNEGTLSLDSFIHKTDTYIEELSSRKQAGDDISKIMGDKVADWIKAYGAPSAKDYEYIEKKFGFTKSEILGEPNTKISITAPIDIENYLKNII